MDHYKGIKEASVKPPPKATDRLKPDTFGKKTLLANRSVDVGSRHMSVPKVMHSPTTAQKMRV